MKPLRIYLENFMSHSLTDIDCTQFNSVLIIGKNKYNDRESNGVGKTTIFKAIDYALFGEYHTKTVDKIVLDGQERCKVIFEFEVPTGIFKIVRSRNKKSGKSDLRLYEQRAGIWHDISQKTSSECETEITKIIKISYRTFKNSILFAQSDLEGLASCTPEGRRLIFKEALNLAIYAKYEKLAKEKIAELTEKILTCKNSILFLKNPEEDLVTLSCNVKKIQDQIPIKEKKCNDLQDHLNQAKIQLLSHKNLITTDVKEIETKFNNLLLVKEEVKKKLNSCEKNLKEKQAIHKTSYVKHLANLQILQQLKEQLTEFKNKNLRSSEIVSSEIEAIINHEANGRAFISSLEKQKTELETPFPEGNICPHCRQILSLEHKTACLNKVSQELQNIKLNLDSSFKKLSAIKHQRAILEQESKNIKIWLSNSSKIEQQINNLSVEIKHDELSFQQLSEIIGRLQLDVSAYNKNLQELSVDEEKLKADLLQLNLDNLNKTETLLQAKVKNLEVDLQNEIKSITTSNVELNIILEKIKLRQQDVEKLHHLVLDLAVLEKAQKLQQLIAQSFGSNGIPTMIIYTILDDLQIEVNKILTKIRPGLEVQFSVALDICYRVNGVERDYEQLSGGQKLMVALSLKLGLSLVIQRRLNVDIRFLELDEVDQSLDQMGIEAFANIIKQWQDKFKIFVITHNESLKQYFNNVITVESDGINSKGFLC